jgi:hypothetical protein
VSPVWDDWQVVGLDELARLLVTLAPAGGPFTLVAVDGHSSSGKTTLAGRLVDRLPEAAVLHSDDIAWHHSLFDWRPLLVDGILAPLRTGAAVSYRPPPWQERGRPGAIEVPAGTRWLVLEGVGASRQDLADLVDVAVYVETDEPERLRRDDERVAAGEISRQDYDGWMALENPFLAADRPWSRADVIVAGHSPLPHDPTTHVVIARRHV